MKTKRYLLAVVLILSASGLVAQEQRFMIRVTDTLNQSVLLENATSSSSSSCNAK